MNPRKKKLIKSMVYDAVGMATISIPLVGPFLDLLWAPIAARKMSKMYPGKKGKLVSAFVFVEELLPFTDVVPTFTLMWGYTYLWQKKQQPLEVKVV